MKVFVTGATGVVGTLAVPRLVSDGHAVTAIGRSGEKRARLEAVGAKAIALDIFDRQAVRRALDGHDVVVNLATHMPPSATRMLLPWEWQENDRVRRLGSATLVDAAIDAGVSRFVQESFAPVYDDGGERWIDEDWPIRPAPYNRTVLDAEQSAARFTASGRVGIVLRFAGFYGSDDFLREVLDVVRKGWSPIPGPPGAYWSSVAHVDAATATVEALEIPAGTYNVCDDDPLTRRDWLDVVAAAAGARPPRMLPSWLTRLGGKTTELLSRSQRLSNAKLKAASRWTLRWPSAREGLPSAIAALRGPHESVSSAG